MKALIGGLVAVVLLGLYVYAVFMGINVANCVAAIDCKKFTTVSFTDGMANAMSLIGGLVSALVIAELAITQPGKQPVARTLTKDPGASSSTFIK